MLRFLLTTVAAVVMALVAPAAPLPKDAKWKSFFPVTLGTQWRYGHRDVGPNLVISKVESVADGTLVTVEDHTKPGQQALYQKILVSREGLQMMEDYTGPYSPGYPLLKLPAAPSDKWSAICRRKSDPFPHKWDLELTFVGEEDVEVKAGKFRAVRVDTSYSTDDKQEKQSISKWYAEGVGLVKKKSENFTTELTYFKLGEEQPAK